MKRKGFELELWTHPDSYMGEEYPEYFKGPARSRDSEPLEESNFRTALEMLGGEQEPEVIVARSSHWAVGWVEQILVHKDAQDKVAILQEIGNSLENYPVLNDEDFFEEEQNRYRASFDSWAKESAIEMLGLEEMDEQGEFAEGSDAEIALWRAVEETFSYYGEAYLDQKVLTGYWEEAKNEMRLSLDPEVGFITEDPRQMKLFERLRKLDAQNRTADDLEDVKKKVDHAFGGDPAHRIVKIIWRPKVERFMGKTQRDSEYLGRLMHTPAITEQQIDVFLSRLGEWGIGLEVEGGPDEEGQMTNQTEECPNCSGTGKLRGTPCPRCGGNGMLPVEVEDEDELTASTHLAEPMTVKKCPTCKGTGEVETSTEGIYKWCPDCGGMGRIKHIDFPEDDELTASTHRAYEFNRELAFLVREWVDQYGNNPASDPSNAPTVHSYVEERMPLFSGLGVERATMAELAKLREEGVYTRNLEGAISQEVPVGSFISDAHGFVYKVTSSGGDVLRIQKLPLHHKDPLAYDARVPVVEVAHDAGEFAGGGYYYYLLPKRGSGGIEGAVHTARTNEEVISMFLEDRFPKDKMPEWGTANLKITRFAEGGYIGPDKKVGWGLINYTTPMVYRSSDGSVYLNKHKYSPTTSVIQNKIRSIANALGIQLIEVEAEGMPVKFSDRWASKRTALWKNRLQKVYDSFEEFQSYAETYGLLERLGFATAEEAWEANPMIQGSTNPEDYKVVKGSYAQRMDALHRTASTVFVWSGDPAKDVIKAMQPMMEGQSVAEPGPEAGPEKVAPGEGAMGGEPRGEPKPGELPGGEEPGRNAEPEGGVPKGKGKGKGKASRKTAAEDYKQSAFDSIEDLRDWVERGRTTYADFITVGGVPYRMVEYSSDSVGKQLSSRYVTYADEATLKQEINIDYKENTVEESEAGIDWTGKGFAPKGKASLAARYDEMNRTAGEHKLIIDSLRDLMAHCPCGWSLTSPSFDRESDEEIRAHAEEVFESHLRQEGHPVLTHADLAVRVAVLQQESLQGSR